MKTPLIAVLGWCLVATGFAATEILTVPLALAPVTVPVVEAPPAKEENRRAGDGLDGLRAQLGGLEQSIDEAGRAVEEMARQRDRAREEAKQSAKAQRLAMEEAAALRRELAEARRDREAWKAKAVAAEEKVRAGALAHAELQKFRGELQGALKEFQVLKGELGEARTMIEDPVERKRLAEEAEASARKREQMAREVEEALAQRQMAEARAEKMRAELQAARKQVALLPALQQEKAAAVEACAAVKEDLAALTDKHTTLAAKLEDRNATVMSLEATVRDLKEGLTAMSAERAAWEDKAGAFQKAHGEAAARLHEAEGRVKFLEMEAAKPDRAREEAEAARTRAMDRLREANIEASKVRAELGRVQKAKTGLEELLIRKAGELRQLKARVRELEEADPAAAPAEEPAGGSYR